MNATELAAATAAYDKPWGGPGLPGKPLTSAQRALHRRASARAKLGRPKIGAGAKILGPLLVGDGAKIGSNAVVVRDVPAGATAVGIPARLVTEDAQDWREEQAARIGFSQYAIAADMNENHIVIKNSAMQGFQFIDCRKH